MNGIIKSGLTDIYYKYEYGKIYEDSEKGICKRFAFSNADGKAENIFIKREIPYSADGEKYYDIITPYGYGGPVITDLTGNVNEFIEEYWTAYTDFCKRENIICEFVRFHPLIGNADLWKKNYDVSYNRKTIAINTADDEFFATQFTPECRNMVRKAAKNGVILSIDKDFNTLDKFIEIYYKTMKKDNAADYYFFTKQYFLDLKKNLKDDVFIVNAELDTCIISTAIFMKSDKFMHYHLSATDPDFYRFAANNAILNFAAEYANKNGIEWLHLGGGLTGNTDDRLFKFKHSFGRKDENAKDFYIGKVIFNKEVYELFCEKAKENNSFNEGLFPQYR